MMKVIAWVVAVLGISALVIFVGLVLVAMWMTNAPAVIFVAAILTVVCATAWALGYLADRAQ